jgi:hypothetical protein
VVGTGSPRSLDEERTVIVDLAGGRVQRFQKFINLLVRHLLSQVRQDVLQLADANEPRVILVEDLETTGVFLYLTGFAEAARSVQNALEGLEVDLGELVRRHLEGI